MKMNLNTTDMLILSEYIEKPMTNGSTVDIIHWKNLLKIITFFKIKNIIILYRKKNVLSHRQRNIL